MVHHDGRYFCPLVGVMVAAALCVDLARSFVIPAVPKPSLPSLAHATAAAGSSPIACSEARAQQVNAAAGCRAHIILRTERLVLAAWFKNMTAPKCALPP